MPLWVWLLVIWLALSALLGWALSRWFRFLRGDFDLDLDGAHDAQARFGVDDRN